MKKIFTLLLCSALFAGTCWGTGTEVIIGTGSFSSSEYPVNVGANYSFSQFIYLASGMGSQSAGAITEIGFRYKYSDYSTKRTWKIYMSNTTKTSLNFNEYVQDSELVFDGEVTFPATAGWYTFELDKSFVWTGSNILITILDNSSSSYSGYAYHYYDMTTNARGRKASGTSSFNPKDNITTSACYFPQIKFVFGTPTPTYDAPTNVKATDISSSSAKINWAKKDSAKVKLQYVKHGQTDTTTVNDINAAFYVINSLAAETQYDYKVYAAYPTGISSAVAGSFTTTEASSHSHDGVDFTKWDATDALPTSAGNYYLTNNVSVSKWTLPDGDTKICLNGKTITITGTSYNDYINLTSGKNLSIYDNEGNGVITINLTFSSTIKVNGGTLSLYGGAINNTASSSSSAYAIDVTSGTFNIKGDVKMSTGSSAANVYLRNTASVITLAGAITNTTKLSVNKAANSNITSGWSTQMGSADPADYFSSKNSDAPSVILVSGEAQLGVPSITINETGTNTFSAGGPKNVNLVRTFQAGILNTISLPFALTDAQLQETFGSDYELYELGSSSLTNGVLSLMFNKVTALDDGYPYLLRVSSTIENPSFSSVTLTKENHTKQTTAVDMVAVISEKNITNYESVLFLNAAGELNWSTAAGNFRGMRAYFKLNSGSPSAISARRIVLGTNTTTGVVDVDANVNANCKVLKNGQLVIIKNGVKYNALGQIVK